MFGTGLQIELEEAFLEYVGIIQEHRRFVASVEERRIPGEGTPKRGLRIREIEMRERIPVVFEIEKLVFKTQLKFNRRRAAADEIYRLVERHVIGEIIPQLGMGCR